MHTPARATCRAARARRRAARPRARLPLRVEARAGAQAARRAQAHVERELGACEVEHVACGAGLERIYTFLATDEPSNRPRIDLSASLVRAASSS